MEYTYKNEYINIKTSWLQYNPMENNTGIKDLGQIAKQYNTRLQT